MSKFAALVLSLVDLDQDLASLKKYSTSSILAHEKSIHVKLIGNIKHPEIIKFLTNQTIVIVKSKIITFLFFNTSLLNMINDENSKNTKYA